MAHHHHGHSHSHSHTVEHIEEAARRLWGHCASLRLIGGLDELAIRLCMAQAAHHPHTRPRAGVLFTADGSVTELHPSRAALSSVLSAPFELTLLGPGQEPVNMKTARDVMKIGSTVASVVMKGGAKVVLASMNPYRREQAAALLCWLADMEPAEALSWFGDEINQEMKANTIARTKSMKNPNPIGLLAALGNAELLAIAGMVLQAGSHGRAIVFDNLSAALAGVVAARVDPSVKHSMFCASFNKTKRVIQQLGVTPVCIQPSECDTGIGAMLALHQLDLAADLMNELK